ncbi:MAG TPA: MFS transporter [Roseiarcus sp.]
MSLSSTMDPARANGLARARAGVTAIFFANGLCIGAWAVAIPEIKALFGLSDARLSMILWAAGVGGLTAMPLAGVLPSKIGGTGRALRISGPLTALLLAALPQTYLLSPGIGFLTACGFLFGFVNILMDVPMNAHASVVEARWGTAIMSSFHAAWSAGGLIGSAFGGLLIARGAGPALQLGIEAGIALAVVVAANVMIGVGDTRAAARIFALPERKLLALSLIAFLAVLVEGAVTDWSALYMSSEVGAPRGAAAIGFSGYALMMVAGRLLGDRVVRAIGRTRTILYGAALLFAGIGLATGPVSEPSAVVGFALVGLGVANMVPAAFSASAAAASSPSLGIATSATMAYASLLIGPPLFGAIATVSSLRLAFAILLLAAAGIAALTSTQRGAGT